MRQPLYIIVVGCGRLGSRLASALSEQGHAVVAIDRDEARFSRLPAAFSGFRVEGDATELAVLTRSGVDKADVLVAVTHEDNVNLVVAQVAARVFGVPRVLARLYDTERDRIARLLGIDTICTTSVALDLLLAKAGDGPRREPGATT